MTRPERPCHHTLTYPKITSQFPSNVPTSCFWNRHFPLFEPFPAGRFWGVRWIFPCKNRGKSGDRLGRLGVDSRQNRSGRGVLRKRGWENQEGIFIATGVW